MSRILVVEDSPDLASGLAENLEFEGHHVAVAADGRSALEQVRSSTPDLVILDLMLPELSGFRVLSTLREEGNDVPVLILSGRGDLADKVRGFRFGCDDYLTKPFALLELLGRVQALLRRSAAVQRPVPAAPGSDRVRFGEIEIVPSTHTIYRRGFPVMLRPKEYDLLMALVARNGDVVSRAELLREVWGYNTDVVSRTVDTHVTELRRKLEDDSARPRYILTVRKTGLRLRRD